MTSEQMERRLRALEQQVNGADYVAKRDEDDSAENEAKSDKKSDKKSESEA